jgi:ATP-dependent DNA ligase
MRLKFVPPMMPTLVAKPPQGGDDWMHEAKFDGYRSQIIIDAGLGATQP